mgnify:CR=1 FL=1
MIDKSKQEVKSMKKYIEPAMDVQKFNVEDVITTSGNPSSSACAISQSLTFFCSSECVDDFGCP